MDTLVTDMPVGKWLFGKTAGWLLSTRSAFCFVLLVIVISLTVDLVEIAGCSPGPRWSGSQQTASHPLKAWFSMGTTLSAAGTPQTTHYRDPRSASVSKVYAYMHQTRKWSSRAWVSRSSLCSDTERQKRVSWSSSLPPPVFPPHFAMETLSKICLVFWQLLHLLKR